MSTDDSGGVAAPLIASSPSVVGTSLHRVPSRMDVGSHARALRRLGQPSFAFGMAKARHALLFAGHPRPPAGRACGACAGGAARMAATDSAMTSAVVAEGVHGRGEAGHA